MDKTAEAWGMAQTYHKGQKYGNKEYTWHLYIVGSYLQDWHKDTSEQWLDKLVITAYLHDILEDTSCEYETLFDTFGWEIAQAVDLLTKTKDQEKGEGYLEYIENIKLNALAREVKIADTFCNLSESLKVMTNKKRILKYTKQLQMLVE